MDHENNNYDLVKDFYQYNPIEKDNKTNYQKLIKNYKYR